MFNLHNDLCVFPRFIDGGTVTWNLCNLFMISHLVDWTEQIQVLVFLSSKAVLSITAQ